MAKKEEINLSDFDANFVISSFKNKERRNNPSSIPKALVPEEETRSEEKAREEPKGKRKKTADYEALFLSDAGIPTRSGKLVSIRETYHRRIAKIVQTLNRREVSIFSYIDKVLSHHFDTYQSDITEVCNKPSDDDYFTPNR